MPSTSPGNNTSKTTSFAQILPGTPTESLQSFTTFIFRFKRYVAYISGSQLNILSAPDCLVQAIRFQHDLVAVAAEARSGKIVVAAEQQSWVLRPLTEGWTKVWWEKVLLLRRKDEEEVARCLSWGDDGEMLVAGDKALTLFSALPSSRATTPAVKVPDDEDVEVRQAIWTQQVASPVWQAGFSPTATMIATCGRYDRLVKIWRRLSFEECLFDHTYLPHPGTVTHFQWRPAEENFEERRGSGVSGRHDDEPEVLYTIANDGVLRVWRAGGAHEVDILNLYTTVDLISAIPQSPSLTIKGQSQPTRAPRYAVVLPSNQFCAAVNSAIGLFGKDEVSHSKELLKEMVSKEPDVVVTFDGNGRMSAWGLEGVGCRHPAENPAMAHAYHIAHAEDLQVRLPAGVPALCNIWCQDDRLHLLTHVLGDGGEITWWQGGVETFFSASAPGLERIVSFPAWSGHDGTVLELQSCDGGLVSRSSNEVTQWTTGRTALLKPRRSFGLGPDVLAATTIGSGRLVLTATSSTIALWNQHGRRMARASYPLSESGKFHVISSNSRIISGLFMQYESKTALRWTVILPDDLAELESGQRMVRLQLAELDLGRDGQQHAAISFAAPVALPLDSDRSQIIYITNSGTLTCVRVPDEGSSPVLLATMETGFDSPSSFSATAEFAVVVSKCRRNLVILDLKDGHLEHEQAFPEDLLIAVGFTPKPRQNLVALARSTHVEILAQGRYDRSHTWVSVKTVSIADLGLAITTLAWLPAGTLAVAVGNGILLTDSNLEVGGLDLETRQILGTESDEQKNSMRLLDVSAKLKFPLPVWHPSVLSQMVVYGYSEAAAASLRRLAQQLKFWSVGDELDPALGLSPNELFDSAGQWDVWMDGDTVNDLEEQLDEKSLPCMSRKEQQHLHHVIRAVVYLGQHVKGLDRNALRYLYQWKLQMLIAEDTRSLTNGSAHVNGVPSADVVPEMQWKEICFAYHSTTQQALLDILIMHHDNKLTWNHARRLGIMSWLVEREALENVFEQLGQTSYRSEQPPDPVNASLYYLALHRKPTLLALWRIATWHKEQRTTMNFLKRDFSQADAKIAAKKNAYALMGRRRFHYAAAFFLMADDAGSATSVLAGQCEDAPLAIAVARLYCGDGSPVLRKLLDDRIIPVAKEEGNRWLMTWCHSVLFQKQQAAGSLVKPLKGPKTWQQDEPSTLVLYKQLRNEPSEHEYTAVLKAARVLRRMGLWLIAMDLVSRWEFQRAPSVAPIYVNGAANAITNGIDSQPKSMLEDFTDSAEPEQVAQQAPLVLGAFESPQTDPSDKKSEREAKAAELLAKIKAKKQTAISPEVVEKKQAPTQFKEPDPNSLLDSFGF